MAKPRAEPQKIKLRPLAKRIQHEEKVIEAVLAKEYCWTRPLIADFLKQLREHD